METTGSGRGGGGGGGEAKIPKTKSKKAHRIRANDTFEDLENWLVWDDDDDDADRELFKEAEMILKSFREASDSPPRLDEDLLPFDQLLSFIGFLGLDETRYREIFESYPLVENNQKCLSIEETNLGRIYKCDAYHHQCHFTTDCPESFEKHLNQKHPNQSLYCFYCTKGNHDHDRDGCKSFAKPSVLLDHIKDQHSSLQYQCNLCFYRAYSPHHIFIHQAYEHLDLFLQTILKSKQIRVEDGSLVRTCKIIVCPPSDDTIVQNRTYEYYLKHYGSKKKADKKSSGGRHCIYCNAQYNKENLLYHFVFRHPQLPILAELHDKDFSGISLLCEPVAIMNDFMERLKLVLKTPTYDQAIMNAAFQAYTVSNDVEDSSKGTKRKRSDGDDHPANQDEMDSAANTAPSASKRRPKGFFGGYIPVPSWNQTKTALGMATTAIVALGFYKFAQYLPLTLKKLTD